MTPAMAVLLFCVLLPLTFSQTAPNSATVPITLDHNRIIIDVYFSRPDGSKLRVRGWVDTGAGADDLWIAEGLAKKLGLASAGEAQTIMGSKVPAVKPPEDILIGEMPVRLGGIKEAKVQTKGEAIAPGLSAQINLPAAVLRNYDVVVDYPNREFTIAAPGAVHFAGTAVKPFFNPENGIIQIPSKIGDENHNLGLDLGATVSFIAGDVLDQLRKTHPQWPAMTGAVGPANLWGIDSEPGWKLLRIPRVVYGPLTLTNVVAGDFPTKDMTWFEKRAGTSSRGIIGADALLNYKVGIDYAHSTVYFQQLTKVQAPNMDVVGLVLRPEWDERYSVLGVADYEGKPSVPDVRKGDVLLLVDEARATGGTMGQVWSLLSGRPGDVRTLTFEREGKQFTVKATVRRFLAAEPAKPAHKKKK
jgi:hypothetical protein